MLAWAFRTGLLDPARQLAFGPGKVHGLVHGLVPRLLLGGDVHRRLAGIAVAAGARVHDLSGAGGIVACRRVGRAVPVPAVIARTVLPLSVAVTGRAGVIVVAGAVGRVGAVAGRFVIAIAGSGRLAGRGGAHRAASRRRVAVAPRLVLPGHGVIAPEEARRRAGLILLRIKAGEEPVPEPLAATLAGGPTVADLARHYLEDHVAVRCKAKTEENYRQAIGKHIEPALRLPANPNGRPNADVLKPWMNGMDVTRRPAGKWIVDFGWSMTEAEAALYEEPFRHVREYVHPMRQRNRRETYRVNWWRHVEPRQGMWRALEGLPRYIATPRC